MGLLEYQAMPSLREEAHDGWLCTFTLFYTGNSSWKFHQLAGWAAPVSATANRYGKENAGGTARLSRTKSHLPSHCCCMYVLCETHTATKIPFLYSFSGNCVHGLSPNFHIPMSVSDLYIPRIGPHIFLQQNRQID